MVYHGTGTVYQRDPHVQPQKKHTFRISFLQDQYVSLHNSYVDDFQKLHHASFLIKWRPFQPTSRGPRRQPLRPALHGHIATATDLVPQMVEHLLELLDGPPHDDITGLTLRRC